MKVLRITAAALFITALVSTEPTVMGQETPAAKRIATPIEVSKPLVGDVNLGTGADWKTTFQGRVRTNQILAKQLEAALEEKSLAEFNKAVSEVAAQMPIESHIRNQLKDVIATEDESEATKSTVAEIIKQLSFEPKLETALPENFTAPTPVGEIEVKSYQSYRMAKTSSADRSAFFRLFNHIKKNEIEMTSPVQMNYQPAEGKFVESTMAFLYPNSSTGSATESSDGKEVKVFDAKPTSVISMGWRGRPSSADIENAVSLLTKASLKFPSRFELSSGVRVLGYNGPSVPASDQFYEIQLELLTPKDLKDSNVR